MFKLNLDLERPCLRCTRHQSESDLVLSPSNITLIKFNRSDGDAKKKPTHTANSEYVNPLGKIAYMQPLPFHGDGTAKQWKLGVAAGLATLMNLPKLEGLTNALEELPEGYYLFEHRKGVQNAPRRRIYLYGKDSAHCSIFSVHDKRHDPVRAGTKRRFRSIPEFIPHAFWLLHDLSIACKCTYCSKEPQKKISSSMGLRRVRRVVENTASDKFPKSKRGLFKKTTTVKHGKRNDATGPSPRGMSVQSSSHSERDRTEVEEMLIPKVEVITPDSDEEVDQLDEDSYL